MVYIETLKRIKVVRIPTEHGNYNVLGMYTGFGRFDGNYLAEYLHTTMRIIPKKAIVITYHQNNDPFENFNNEEDNSYGFVDFLWMDDDSERRRLLGRGKEYRVHISVTETWVITLQDPEVNLMRHSHSSYAVYFSDTQEIPSEMPFDADEESPTIGYHNMNILVSQSFSCVP